MTSGSAEFRHTGAPAAELAIIGGTGLYSLFAPDQPHHIGSVDLETPFGAPSATIQIADVGGRRVAFLPRHGPEHRWPAHAVPYRANLWALHHLGVSQVIAPCATGSLRRQTAPGSLVVPDQLIDQTHRRSQTFHDEFHGQTFHAQFAEPYCERLRRSLLASADTYGWPAVDGATMVVIDGPRFSTRAEVEWYAAAGWDLVNMTGHPEAVLARELFMCYSPLALVTNYSANLIEGPGVSEAEVYRLFGQNIDRMRGLLIAAVTTLADAAGCDCSGVAR